MLSFLHSLSSDPHWTLVIMAALLSVASSLTAPAITRRVRASRGRGRMAWIGATVAAITGASLGAQWLFGPGAAALVVCIGLLTAALEFRMDRNNPVLTTAINNMTHGNSTSMPSRSACSTTFASAASDSAVCRQP